MQLEMKKPTWLLFIGDLSNEIETSYLKKYEKYNEVNFEEFFNKNENDIKKEIKLDKTGILECLLLFATKNLLKID